MYSFFYYNVNRLVVINLLPFGLARQNKNCFNYCDIHKKNLKKSMYTHICIIIYVVLRKESNMYLYISSFELLTPKRYVLLQFQLPFEK